MMLPSVRRRATRDVNDVIRTGGTAVRRRPTSGRRLVAAMAAGAVAAVTPMLGHLPGAAAAPTAVDQRGGTFSSSFESGDRPLDWTSTVEAGRSRNVTGPTPTGLPGDVTRQVTKVTASGENLPNETAAKAADGDPNSKWLVFAGSGWLQYQFPATQKVVRYALTSANDSPERDPMDWTVQGSDDGTTWTTLDTRTGQTFASRFQTRTFDLPAAASYAYYKLDVSKVGAGSNLLQVADFLLSDGSAFPPPPQQMVAETGTGPTSAYNSKTDVGFTGAKALHYAGHVGTGGGYSYDKVYDVSVPVGKRTQLSYRIFPELTGGDLTYPSTYAAVDLHFTDGTYLSQLPGAVDQLGFGMSPQAQGASKALYANQWNARESLLGQVAAGKTIDRIIVGYDNPAGPADFGGWVDDVVLADAKPVVVGRPSDHVVTTRGTMANGNFSRGNNIPATAVPNGFNFWTPVTDAGSTSFEYAYHASNDANNRTPIQAFSISHEPSPWMGDRDTFQFMPSIASGTPDANRTARALPYGHENETARAHYYGVTFDNGLKTEITPTDHAAVLKFTYPGSDANLILDNVSNAGGLTIDAATGTFSGYSDVRAGEDGATRMFVYGTLDKPVTASGKLPGGGGADVTGYVKVDTGASHQLVVRVATSLISLDQAKKNLSMEVGKKSFGVVQAAAQQAWDDVLGRVEVEGATADQLTTLYSNLYRMYLYPNSGFENTGTVSKPRYRYASPVQPAAASTPTQTGAQVEDGQVYVNNGFWDTYRTAWPAYSLLTPNHAAQMIDGFTQQYRDGGWIARWSSPGYANLMTGTSSDIAFADAMTKGVPLKDAQSVYDAALRNATVVPPGDPNNSSVGRKGIQVSQYLGFTPTTVGEGVSWALEGYINDYGLSQMGAWLAKQPGVSAAQKARYTTQSEYFRNRATSYVNMFDPKVGFFQGFTPDHTPEKTPEQFSPLDWGGSYTETDGWNFAFHAPDDGNGLANLYGGKAGLATKLDQFFATPETATHPGGYGGVIHEMLEARDVRMGQLGMSNQVSHHIPYMYDYAGQPSKTAEKVREIMSRLYQGSEIGQGYPGDEDNGEMSAWWLFSSMGFYPLQMGDGHYAVGSPLFTKMTVHMDNGKTLTINAPQNSATNIYVQRLVVNGKDVNTPSIDHADIADGGTVDFVMGPKPSRWGTTAAMPSITTGSKAPQPISDLTGPSQGQASGVAGAASVFDNTSMTQTSVATGASVGYRFVAPKNAVQMYTVTNGATGDDPTSWVLEGSRDGKKWFTVDQRHSVRWTWKQQNQPFSINGGGRYQYYRLTVTGTSSGQPAGISEVELMGKPGAVLSDQAYVDSWTQGLDLGDTSAVTANLDLPSASGDLTVTWKSGDAAWLNDAGQLVKRPAVGADPVTVPITVTVTKGTATATRTFEVTIAPWTAADETYPAGDDVATSFAPGQAQPLHNDRLISDHVAEFCCGIGGMETALGTADNIPQHDGREVLLYSGEAVDPEASLATSRVLAPQGVWVKPGTTLSYWVYPESGTGRVSTYAVMDVHFTDGTYLHDLAAPADDAGTSDPTTQGTLLKNDQWQQVTLDVGEVAAGKQVESVAFTVGSGTANGQFRGFVDDVTMSHPASTTPAPGTKG